MGKISELPQATESKSTDVIPIVQEGRTKQIVKALLIPNVPDGIQFSDDTLQLMAGDTPIGTGVQFTLQKRAAVQSEQMLSEDMLGAAVSAFTIKPNCPTMDGIRNVQIAVGDNLLSEVLHSELYNNFKPSEGTYGKVPLALKAETEYILVKLTNDLSTYTHSYLKSGEQSHWFCHKTNANLNLKYRTFTTPHSGEYAIYSTYLYLSQKAYQQMLETDWVGLSLMEKDKSVVLQKTFSEPLYAVSAQISDSYDFISGALTRCTAKAQLSEAQFDSAATIQISDTAYRYKMTLPTASATRVLGCIEGLCASLPTLEKDITTGEAYAEYKSVTGQTEGIWFGASDGGIYVVSERNPNDFTAWLEENPLEILYAAVKHTVNGFAEMEFGEIVKLPKEAVPIQITPDTISAEMQFSANASALAKDLETRLSKLESDIEKLMESGGDK